MFKRFSDIENSYRDKYIELIRLHGFDDPVVEWILTEKAHGANFSILVDNSKVEFARREAILKPDEAFFGYQIIVPHLTDGGLRIFESVIASDPTIVQVQIYGELIGGNYPHPDVKQVNEASQIAKGVYYAPGIEFYGIDVRVTREDGIAEYLTYGATQRLIANVGGLYCAPPLARGTLDQMLAYKNEYTTTIPSHFRLPELEDNICEGNVIRPNDPLRFKNGKRVSIKNKNEKFAENGKHKGPREPIELSEEAERILDEALGYVNENRYEAVVSKEGEIDYFDLSNIGKLIGLMSKDAIKDITKDIEAYSELDKKERGVINKQVVRAVKNIILPRF